MLDDPYPKVQPGPPKPSVIMQPQIFLLPAGTERYVVEGCGAVLVRVEPGDHVQIVNTEGGQPCEILCAGRDGKADAGLLGTVAQGPAQGLMALMSGDDQSLRGLRMGLDARGIDLAQSLGFIFSMGRPPLERIKILLRPAKASLLLPPHIQTPQVLWIAKLRTLRHR